MKTSLKQESQTKKSTNKKRVEYNILIGNHLHKRISKHMLVLKHLDKNSRSKQDWVQEAIHEKLTSEIDSDEHPGGKFLHLKIDSEIFKTLQEKVDSLKASYTSMSKKVFIEEAIFEKLEREENKKQGLLKKMLNLSSNE